MSSQPRPAALGAFRRWLSCCSQPLLVHGSPFCGKTYFLRELSREPNCAAYFECPSNSGRTSSSSSIDVASILSSLSEQLSRRFPNLVLPSVSSLTLLTLPLTDSLLHLFRLPLSSLPPTAQSLFVLIDGLPDDCLLDFVIPLSECLPCWLRLCVSCRTPLPKDFSKRFHLLSLTEFPQEFRRFVQVQLPQFNEDDIIKVANNSWYFVSQLERAYNSGLLSLPCIPSTSKDLLDDLISALPLRLSVYVLLVKAARNAPSLCSLITAGQLATNEERAIVEREIRKLARVCAEQEDPFILFGEWNELPGDLTQYHTIWAEFYKMKRKRTAQDVVELAYHLAHSNVSSLDSLHILRSVRAPDLLLQCPVLDSQTTTLLTKAGASLSPIKQWDFVYLCAVGDVEELKKCQNVDEHEWTMGIVIAAARGHEHVVEWIAENRRDVATMEVTSNSQWNALRSAACNGHVNVLKKLVQYGCAVDDCGLGGRTALRAAAWAGHEDIVRILLEAGANVERRDSEDRTPLMASAFMDFPNVCRLLIKYRARVDSVDSAGATALHLSLSNGSNSKSHEEVVCLLLNEGADVNVCDKNGRNCLHLAAYHGDSQLQQIIEKVNSVDAQDSLGRTALMLAASQGKTEAIRLLMKHGANIDWIDLHGRTALQLAAIHGHLATVNLLIELGADEAHKDNEGAVALHYAVSHDDPCLARALANDVTLNSTDGVGNTPLIVACQHRSKTVLEELIQLGADVNILTLEGYSALRISALAGNTEIVQNLMPLVSDTVQSDCEATPLLHSLLINKQTAMAKLLIQSGKADPLALDAHQRSVAHIVASMNDVPSAEMLHQCCPSLTFDERDEDGRSPLMTAVWSLHSRIALYLLGTIGVNPNSVDSQGASALSVASQLGADELLVVLLRFGADPSLVDKQGRKPADIAQLFGHTVVINILQSATGSAESSGFGSLPHSPQVLAKSFHPRNNGQSQSLRVAYPRLHSRGMSVV